MIIVPGSAFIFKSGDPYWGYVVLLMNGHEFADDSIYDTTIVNNSATISSDYFVGNNSGFFETASNVANFTLFGDDFTIEFELYRTESTAAGAILGKLRDNSGVSLGAGAWLISMGLYGDVVFQANSADVISESAPPSGQWNHLAFSFTKDDLKLRYYLNGSHVVTADITSGWVDYENPIGIMAEDPSGGIPLLGYGVGDCHLRGLRITKGIARYTSEFTPPSTPLPNS